MPIAVLVLEVGRKLRGSRRHVLRQDTGALERDAVGETVEHVGLHLAGLGLGENLRGLRNLVGARIFQLDPGILFLEGVLQWPHRLIDDQHRVPDDLTLFLRRLDQRRVGRARFVGAAQNDRGQQAKRDRQKSSTSPHLGILH